MIELIRTDSTHHDFTELVMLLDADLHVRDGDDHSFFAQFNKVDSIKHVVVAYYKECAAGCGAIKAYAEGVAEVKRMFVLPEFRGQGVANRVLAELEAWAAELNFQNLILETGKAMPEAIRLYTKNGYQIIPNYGQYKNIETSICMTKAVESEKVLEQ
ncbi:GNAT family N-acetyltransferase [Rufibacter roseus]|uniref:GNAT family N-acetyltransferase n=1 Tax=Rufibacter roseus TaxID=1567108 RepID=A0ABW2DF86_9BACT|nr:GNAT family N-acetyltransferase [Rufibacter roseus]